MCRHDHRASRKDNQQHFFPSVLLWFEDAAVISSTRGAPPKKKGRQAPCAGRVCARNWRREVHMGTDLGSDHVPSALDTTEAANWIILPRKREELMIPSRFPVAVHATSARSGSRKRLAMARRSRQNTKRFADQVRTSLGISPRIYVLFGFCTTQLHRVFHRYYRLNEARR